MYKGLSKCLTVLLVFLSISSFAQETVSSLSGVIKDEKGSLIQGATIQLLHVPTGAITKTQTNKNGIFNITNLKPGGPYTVFITFVGFKEEKTDDVNLNLGNNPDLNVVMKVNTGSLEAVTVTTTKRNTNGVTIGRAQMNTLPTLGRSITDFTRLTPQSNNNSFAGTNFRYNNLTVEGAVNNDAFGFSNSAGGVSGGVSLVQQVPVHVPILTALMLFRKYRYNLHPMMLRLVILPVAVSMQLQKAEPTIFMVLHMHMAVTRHWLVKV